MFSNKISLYESGVLKNFFMAVNSGVSHMDNIGLLRTNSQKCITMPPKPVTCADIVFYKNKHHIF